MSPFQKLGLPFPHVGNLLGSPRGGGGEAFDPLVYNPLLWLDGADITTLYQDSAKTTPVTANNDPVGAVEDKSGNGNDCTQGTDDNRPLYKTGIKNGLSALFFDGTNDDLVKAILSAGLNQPFIYFAVAQLNASRVDDGNFSILMDGISDRAFLSTYPPNTPDSFTLWGGSFVADGDSDSDWHVWAGVFNGVSSVLRLDRSQVASGDSGANDPTGIRIGARDNAIANWWLGHIAEILIYPTLLDGLQISDVENYLASKWGI